MDITEKWIAKAAGWKASKAGKDLFKQNAVIDSSRKANIITGTLRSSGNTKPTRVTVKIHSDTDIDTVCPRIQCRRTGEICHHAVALMLHSISNPSENSTTPHSRADITTSTKNPQKPSHPVKPLQIQLPPNFPEPLKGGQGGISIKLTPVSEDAEDFRPHPIDTKLTSWLIQHTGKANPPILGLRGQASLNFLRLITDHPRITLTDQPATILQQGSRIPMTLSRDHDRIIVNLSPNVLENGTAWYAEDSLYLWDHQHRYLIIHDVSQLWNARHWQRIIDGNPVSLPLTEFLSSLDAQSEFIIWDDDSALTDIPISVADPSITLVLDGSTQLLSAQIKVHYSSTDIHTIGLRQGCDINFPILAPSPSRNAHPRYLTRNREAEDIAAGTLMQAGFNITDPRGIWQLNTEDAIIEFLTATLPSLENNHHWNIEASNKLSSQKNNIVRIIPHFELQGNANRPTSSCQDWLAFDVTFTTDSGKDIPKEVVQRMLASGKRSGSSKNGKQVIISNFDADTVETVLRDTNPRQENNLYYAPKAQAAYLKRLQSHYSNKTPKQPDLSIIKTLPAAIQETLRPYQEQGIAWLYERAQQDGAALLADDMGLGKTLQTLSLIHLLKGNAEGTTAPNIVVCPTSLLGNWHAECQKFYPGLNTLILHGQKRKDYFDVAHSADIIITSYALIARDIEFYTKQRFHTLVIDEASLIRNPDTQAAIALRKLDAQHRIALTGTPVENAIRDLWSLFHFILPGYLGTQKDFQQHYQQPLSNSTGTNADQAIMKRLRMRVEPFMLRRTKAKVAKDLPPKILQTIFCEPTPIQQKTYTQLLKQGTQNMEALNDKQANAGAARIQMLTVLLRLRQAATDLRLLDSEMDITMEEASGKMLRLLELLTAAKEGNHRVLIFSQFTSMLSLIKIALNESNITFAYLDGSTKDRAKEVEKFQSPTGPDTFLISLKAGGYGLNLTAADTVIHVDPWWNPAVEAQATDRAYRIGQTKPTTVYKLVTKGTVEEKIIRLQEAKQGLINATLGDENAPLMQGLNQQEIASLLK